MITSKTNTILVLLAVTVIGLGSTSVTSFAETEVQLYGTYQGQDTSMDENGGTFSDVGNYSIFDKPIATDGTFEFIPDPTREDGEYTLVKYTLSDGNGNNLSIESTELGFTEYANGKYGVSLSTWKVVSGEGKFEGATGQGMDKTIFDMEDFSYKGMISGTLNLAS